MFVKKKYKRLKGSLKPTLYFDDIESYTANSFYFQKNQDTTAYLVCSMGLKLDYNTQEQHYQGANTFIKKSFLKEPLNEYFKFYLSLKNIRKYKLGLNQIHYYHNGANFDFIFLLKYLIKQPNIKYISCLGDIDKKQPGVYLLINWTQAYKGFDIYKVYNDRTVHLEFRDNRYLFATSIKALGKSLNFEKMDYEASTEEVEKTGKINDELINYCFRDCEIMLKNFINYIPFLPHGTKIPVTIGSWARQQFLNGLPSKNNENKFNVFRKLTGITKKQRENINQLFQQEHIYKGGLTSFNPKYRLQTIPNIYVEDVVSQYPHKMVLKQPYGDLLEITVEEINNFDCVFIKKTYYNISKKSDKYPDYIYHPSKLSMYQSSAEQYTIFETKQFIQEFEQLHNWQKAEIERIWAFKTTTSYFGDYVNKYIDLKEKSPKGSPARNYAKLMLNCLYGKLAQADMIDKQIFIEMWENREHLLKGEDWKLMNEQYRATDLPFLTINEFAKTPFTYLHIASWITSLARAYLLKRTREIVEKGGVVYYHDTDSNFFYIDDVSKLKYGKKLGMWDYDPKEDFYKYLFILGSKKYLLFNNLSNDYQNLGGYKMGAAGINPKQIILKNTNAFFKNEPFEIFLKQYTPSGLVLAVGKKQLINNDVYLLLKLKYDKELCN